MNGLRGVLALGVIGLTCLSGCHKASTSGGATGQQTITIGMIAKSQSNDVFQVAYVGAKDAAAELGQKYNCKIVIDWQTPTDEDATQQAESIGTLADQNVDGILCSCSNASALTPAIDRAVDKGIPVICFDSDAPQSKRLACYGTDDKQLGTMLADDLGKATGGTGTYAILAGSASAPNLIKRVQAVRAEMAAKYPNMHEISTGAVYHPETPSDAVLAVRTTMTTNPNITAWVFVGGWPLFTDGALTWDPGSIKLVSCDAIPKALQYLRDGRCQEEIGQDCYGWGHRTVEMLVDKKLGIDNKDLDGMDPVTHCIPNPLTIVTKDNVESYQKNWDVWLTSKNN